ncbi:MAG TPA: cyclase family protein [Sedimentisphaerales bacterium]|nr:cyclase family protein [Sedimentisphaerales bacterium]
MSRVVDLTLPLVSGEKGIYIEPARHLETDGWNATTLSLYSHCGTHIDAPVHFGVGTQTIDTIPVENLIGPAWVADIRPVEPRALIEPEHLGDIARQFKPGESLLICTGWSAFYGREQYREELPRISAKLARWCVEKKVRMLGVEPPSVADVNNIEELTTIHQILFKGGVIVVEGLANLASLSRPKVTFIALPLKIAGGDGAPARAVAIEET